MDREALKRQAGEAAAELVRPGMVVGLGTGSTVRHTLEALGRRVAGGLAIRGVPTSKASEDLARRLGIPLTTLDDDPVVDLTVDGADEFDPAFRLIKGGGGALTREKIVARASRRMAVVADHAKEVARLGSTFPVPLEVIDFGKTPVLRLCRDLGAEARIRTGPDGRAFRTDNGNPIVDAKWPALDDPEGLERKLESHPAVVACGLFLGLCDTVFVARPTGVVRLERPSRGGA